MSDFMGLDLDPILQFQRWYGMAREAAVQPVAEVVYLSTIDLDGFPDSRVVLLRHVDEEGFVFYTNSESTKGQSLARVPEACMLFYWEALKYQVRVQGHVSPISEAESDRYFSGRPRLSQLGAWASEQSRVLGSRVELEERVAFFEKKFEGKDVSRPPHWIGYRIVPRKMEFFIERPFRLHDRFLYVRDVDGSWQRSRLNP